MSKKNQLKKRIVANNKKARFNYNIENSIEVGIVLFGSEVKSIREGRVNIAESYAIEKDNEIFLLGAYISSYKNATQYKIDTVRPRKLLLHKREIKKFIGKIKLNSYTLVPLSLYFNEKNIIKLDLALCSGKNKQDKRQSIKERDWKIEKDRMFKNKH